MNIRENASPARVLIIAGSDSGGGAGIQADIKTVAALGGYAATAISALTVQNTLAVSGILPVPPEFVQAQMRAVLDDIGADALKTGMLHGAAVIEAVVQVLEELRSRPPLVVDPVMVAESGARLLEADAVQSLRQHLLPLATVITPNLPEAEVLLGRPITDVAGMRAAARALQQATGTAVLLKGGHLSGARVVDVLATAETETLFEDDRIDARGSHGTGCTLASAIATGLGQGLPLVEAVGRARRYLRLALQTAPGLGKGHGPVNHGHTVQAFR